jgi:hypothetical protein
MNFSEKLIRVLAEYMNKPENEALRIAAIQNAVDKGKIPPDPTMEQIKQAQVDFMTGFFNYMVTHEQILKDEFMAEMYHALRGEPCKQF